MPESIQDLISKMTLKKSRLVHRRNCVDNHTGGTTEHPGDGLLRWPARRPPGSG